MPGKTSALAWLYTIHVFLALMFAFFPQIAAAAANALWLHRDLAARAKDTISSKAASEVTFVSVHTLLAEQAQTLG